jgi:hypothetical protein
VILLWLSASRGDDHSMSLIYESKFIEFSVAGDPKARESPREVGWMHEQQHLAAR